MPEYVVAILFLLALYGLELIYFRLAVRYKIIDKPNKRSSHSRYTVRGGGIVFPIAVLGWWLLSGFPMPLFMTGLLLISLISFVDDLNHVHSKVRFLFHFAAVGSLLFTVPNSLEWYWYIGVVVIMIGTINAWNFMDGINGITGGYSLITLGTLYYINQFVHPFTDERLLIAVLLGLGVFNFFNFRKKAVCFAGDVGSVSIAFIVCFLLVQLIISSQNLLYVGLILLYGLDTSTTMIFRAVRKENIFDAHRSHFYPFLVNELMIPHLLIAALYCAAQLGINLFIVTQFYGNESFSESFILLLLLLGISSAAFLGIRFSLEGKGHLMQTRS